ncbi:MAG: hypothetical protein NVV73_18710 [Cellvibrionaceae bacterium]|nr:hypothetical protein [Cellvibrionaceae bacterium]
MKPFNKSTNTLIAICASSCLLISGCSSSDKSPSRNALSNQQQSPDIGVTQTEISGNVIKGAVKNADVYFYSLGDNGVSKTPFTNTKTDSNGAFSVTIPSSTLSDAVYVEVQAAADGSSQMICDAEICGSSSDGEDANGNGHIDFGELVNLSDDFRLSGAVTNFKNSENLSVSVTPISHLALQRAKRKGKLDADTINNEMNELAALLNLPATLSQLTAVDITRLPAGDPALDSIRYSLYSAAIAGYAHNHKLTLAAALKKIDEELFGPNGEVNRDLLLELLRLAQKSRREAGERK